MSLRPKTRRRVLSLTIAALVVGGLGGVAALVQLHRHEAARQSVRTEGLAALGRGDYIRAVNKLTVYLGDNRTDPPATYALALAQVHVPRAEQANLIAARGLLVRYLELVPDDDPQRVAAQRQLLDVYRKLQFWYEANQLADAVLARDPDDLAALTAKWDALGHQGDLSGALAAARHLADVRPTDVLAQRVTLELMARLRRPPAELTGRADGLLADQPGDPRFALVRADAAHLAGDHDGALHWLAVAAALPAPDPAFTVTLAGAMDEAGLWPDAAGLLARSAKTTRSPDLIAAAATRLWEDGQPSAALALLADVSPADPTADLRLLGLKGLLLAGGGQSAPASGVAVALAARATDPVAAGWSNLVRVADRTHPPDRRRAVQLCATAVRNDPDNAPARYLLAEAYLAEGETDLGLQSLANACQLAPSWAAPRLRVAQVLLDRGQPTAAEPPARAAAARDRKSVAAQSALALVAYRTLSPRATADQIKPVLVIVERAAYLDPDEPHLTAATVDLLARSGDVSAAVGVGTRAAGIAAPAAAYRLAAVAAADRVPDVAGTAALLAAARPATRPAEALDQARTFAAAGQPDRGRALLAGHATADWQLASLRYREAIDPASPSLANAWAVLADAYPSDLDVQRAVLHSPAAASDRPLVEATIDRLHALTGDDGVEWRLARGRLLLDLPSVGPVPEAVDARPVPKDAAAAVSSSMAEVCRIVPVAADPLVLWSAALDRLGDAAAAADRLRSAIPLAPDDATLPVRQARLLVRVGRFDAAVAAVQPLADRADALPPPLAADVADVYRRAGQPDRAVAVLTAANVGVADPGRSIPLAESLAAAGDIVGATAAFDRVNRSPAATADSVRQAAWFHAGRGDVAAGRADLARLDTLAAAPPLVRAVVRAQFEATFGDPAVARSALTTAAAANPDDPRPWSALAGLALRHGDDAAAIAAADHGLAIAPGDVALTTLKQRATTLDRLRPGPAAQPLRDVLSADPTNAAAATTLDALADGSIDAAAKRNPAFAPAQWLAVAPLLQVGRYDDAAAIARRAMDAAPSDPSPAQLLTQVWTTADRPPLAQAAAEQWRGRSLAAPQAADDAIAAARLRQHDPQSAVDRLAPYVTARPSTATAATTTVYARALSSVNRTAQADALMVPLAKSSPRWRAAWLSIIADTAPSVAAADARRAAVGVQRGSVSDAVAVANFWYTVGARFDDTGALRRGLDELVPLCDTSDVSADVPLLAGAIHQQLGQIDLAESDYRRGLAIDPTLPRAMNNLSWAITLRHGDPAEARRLADQAARLLPADPAVWTTLGQAALAQSDVPAAVTAFRTATTLSPSSAAAWAGLADAEARDGHTGDAAAALDKAESLLVAPAPPPSPTTAAHLRQVRAALGRA